MARLGAAGLGILNHYSRHPRGVRLHGRLHPLTQAQAHLLAPTVIPSPAPAPAINHFGLTTNGMLGVPRQVQAELLAPSIAQKAVNLAGTGGTPPSEDVLHALANAGLLPTVEKLRHERIASNEDIHPDVLAETALTTALTAGLGGVAGLGRAGAEAGIDAAAGAGAGAAENAGGRSAAQILADAARTVRAAPQTARQAAEDLATSAGRRAAAEKVGGGALDYALEHPKLSQVGGLGAAGAVTGKKEGGLAIPEALVVGTGKALNPFEGNYFGQHDVNTGLATLRGIAGAVTGPAALGYSGVQSVLGGTPNPFLNTGKAQVEGIGSIFGNLLSGNPATVQNATEHEAGLVFAPVIPRLLTGERADAALGAVRDTVKGARGRINQALGSDIFRYGPEDQHVFAKTENRAVRRQTSEEGQRSSEPHTAVGHHEANLLRKAARQISTSRRFGNLGHIAGEDLIQTLADTGLRDPRQIEHVRSRFPRDDAQRGDRANLNNVLDHIEKHPEVLQDPNLLAAVQQYREIQHRTPQHADGTDKRATYLTQAHLFGVRDAADRITPEVERLLPDLGAGKSWSRQQAWSYVRAGEHEAIDLHHAANKAGQDARVVAAEVRGLEREERRRQLKGGGRVVRTDEPRRSDLPRSDGQVVRPGVKTKGPLTGERRVEESAGLQKAKARLVDAQAEARAKRAEAKQLDSHLEEIKKGPGGEGGLNEFIRPEHSVSSRARRKLWTPQMVDAMAEETKAAARTFGYDEPIFSHHGKQTDIVKVATGRGQNVRATAVQHVRAAAGDEASLAARDRVDRSFSALVEGSIEAPRRKAGLQEFAQRFFADHAIRLKVDGKPAVRMTEDQYRQAIEGGQISSKGHIWVPESEYKQPFLQSDSVEGSAAAKELDAGAKANNRDPGSYGVVLNEERWKEYKAQVSPERGLAERVTNLISKGAGRVLLFSPAWVETQAVAELLPMVMAHPELLYKGVTLEKAIRRAYDVDPNAAKAWAAVVGESPVRSASASELAPGYQSRTHGMFSDAAKAMERTLAGRVLLSTAQLRPLIMFDQWRQGKYRTILAAAELDKSLNGFTRGLQGMLSGQKLISDELKGKPLEEAIVELGRNPRYQAMLDEQYKYGNDVMGNWTAFTRFERKFGPLAIFYGFLRYAFRWPLTFAKRHPISSTINYFLAQQNANQLEKIYGGSPAAFTQFAEPVVHNAADEPHVVVSGSRFSPGLAAPLQGAAEKNAAAAGIGTLNPAYASVLALFTGVNGFGQYDEDPQFLGLHWSTAAKGMVATPPILRYLGVGASHSQTSEELKENDPNRGIRSFGAPWDTLTAEQAKKENDIIKGVKEYEAGKGTGTGTSDSGNPFLQSSSSSGDGNPFEGQSKSTSSNPFLNP